MTTQFKDQVKELYLQGMTVTNIAEKLDRSRWWIYTALKEAGINTNTGYVLKDRKKTPANLFLDNEWSESLGRSPKKIAEVSGIKQSIIESTLRKRRDSLSSKIEHLADQLFEIYLAYSVDPYKMEVVITVQNKKGEEYDLLLTESDLISRLRESQISTP